MNEDQIVNTSINPDIIKEMRELANANEPFIKIVKYLIKRLHANKFTKIVLIKYLIEAFNVNFSDAMLITGWDFFSDGGWNDDEIEKRFKPLINQRLWENK